MGVTKAAADTMALVDALRHFANITAWISFNGVKAAKSFPAPSINRLIFAIGSLGRASVVPLDVPFDQKANPNGFEFMGLMPARASPSRPLVSVAFGSLPTPCRFAVPCGPPLNAPLFRAGLCARRSRARCMASNQDERHIT
jgi:hypothetical protein